MVELTTKEFMEKTGASSRQLSHWTKTGVFNSLNEVKGIGHPRRWDPEIVPKVKTLVEVSKAFQCRHGSGTNMSILKGVFDNYPSGRYKISENVWIYWAINVGNI